jgi:hypothetical protein
MLPDSQRQLLTAYVDGELSRRQRRQVARLLERSPDARLLLSQLQQDAAALGSLRAPPLDFDLSDSVILDIRARRLSPIRRRAQPLAQGFPAWVAVAVAASVLCAISLASYIGFAAYLSHSSGPSPDANVAKKDGPPPSDRRAPAPGEKPETPPDSKNEIAHNETTPKRYEFVGPPEPGPGDDNPAIAKNPSTPKPDDPAPPDPGPMKDDLGPALTDRAMERFELEKVVGAAKPVIVKLHDLDQADPRKRLNDELAQSNGFRLELPCDNGTRAFDRLQAACKDQKIGLLIDQKAQQRLKATQYKTNYVLYIENVTAEELSRLVQQLGADDKKAAAKKANDAQFDRLVVTRLTKRDYEELAKLLGVDPSKVEPIGPLGTDLRRPFPEQTAEQIGKALEGENSKSKSADGRQALVLAYNPVVPPKNSPEVKRFLDGRKPGRADTVRVIIVLRST